MRKGVLSVLTYIDDKIWQTNLNLTILGFPLKPYIEGSSLISLQANKWLNVANQQ